MSDAPTPPDGQATGHQDDWPIDYVVVANSGDLPQLALQAAGFERFHKKADLGKILIVSSDDDPEPFQERFIKGVLPIYRTLAAKVQLVAASALLPGALALRSTRRRQQALRLAAWRAVDAPVHVSLDPDTHLIRPCARKTYATAEGRLVLARRRLWPAGKQAMAYFGIPEEVMPAVAGHTITPYPLVTRLVEELCTELARRGTDLPTLFEQEPGLQEYTLYYAWLAARQATDLYDIDAPFPATGFWPLRAADEGEALERALALAERPHIRWLGIHARAGSCPVELRDMITEFWTRVGLTASPAAGDAILDGQLPDPEGLAGGAPAELEAEEAPEAGDAGRPGPGRRRAAASASAGGSPDPVEHLLLPGFQTGRDGLDLLKAFAGLCGPRVLDVGCYRGASSLVLSLLGKRVEAVTVGAFWPRRLAPVFGPRGITARDGNLETLDLAGGLDGIWAAHVLQNARNPGLFLDRCRALLADDGWLAVLVPPMRGRVVAGRLYPGWNLGGLMFSLCAAGFDLTRGHFVVQGENVTAMLPKAPVVPQRHDDAFADADLWPFPFDRREGFNGGLGECNWTPELRERMAVRLSMLAVDGPEAARLVAERLASIWV